MIEPAGASQPWRRPLLFSLLFFCGGLSSLLLTPPQQEPDGPTHVFRAYQLSEGHLRGEKRGEISGGELPTVVEQDCRRFGDLVNSAVRLTLCDWSRRVALSPALTPLETHRRKMVGFPNTVLYSPVAYLPQALGIALARSMQLPVVIAVYCAGLFSLLACALLLFTVLYALDGNWRTANLCFLIAGMPMSIFLAASPSSDGVLIMLSLATLAFAQRMRRQPTQRSFVALVVFSALLGLAKGVYFLVPLGCIPIAFPGRPRDWIKRRRELGILLGCTLAPIIVWSVVARGLYHNVNPAPGIDPSLQLRYVLLHPFGTLRLFVSQLYRYAHAYNMSFIGDLGWLDTLLPDPLINTYTIALLLIPLVAAREEPAASRYGWFATLWALAACGAFLILICLLEYLVWVPVGEQALGGLQGRHLIPIAALFLSTLPALIRLGPRMRAVLTALIVCGWSTSMLVVDHVLLHRYWTSGC